MLETEFLFFQGMKKRIDQRISEGNYDEAAVSMQKCMEYILNSLDGRNNDYQKVCVLFEVQARVMENHPQYPFYWHEWETVIKYCDQQMHLQGKPIDLEQLKKSLREDTILVSIAVVDSELGTIQPISEIAKIVKENSKAYFHTDATQAIGKVNIDYKYVDFLTFAPHKFFGINGSGVLINFNDIKITPLIHGGKSTTIYRSGTPVSANAVCIAMALQLATKDLEKKINYVKELNSYLIKKLKMINGISINSPKYAIPNTINFSIKNAKIIVNKLYEKGVYVSMQSACSLGTSPSKSVYALTKSKERASNSIRVSITHITTKKQINEFIRILKEIINEDNNY